MNRWVRSGWDSLRRLPAVTKVKETTLLFAEDHSLNAGSGPEIQVSMDKFSTSCYNFGLTVPSASQRPSCTLAAPHTLYTKCKITIKGQKVQAVNQFKHLGSTVS